MPALPGKKLRTACDICHQGKMRCSGGTPCTGCRETGYFCYYSVSQRLGRPKGTRNKRARDAMDERQYNNHDSNNELDASRVAVPVHQLPEFTPLPQSDACKLFQFSEPDSLFMNAEVEGIPFDFEASDDFWTSIGTGADGEAETTSILAMAASPTPRTFRVSEFASTSVDAGQMSYIPPAGPLHSEEGTASAAGSSLDGKTNDANAQRQQSKSLTSPSKSPSSCNCLEVHINLLYRLRELEKDSSTPSNFDAIMIGAQEALTPWKNLIECTVCQQDDDQGVLLLSAMSIRSILRRLQRLCVENGWSHEGIDSGKGKTAVASLKVGNYEASQEEQTLVVNVLLLHTLAKIKIALVALKEKLQETRQRTDVEPNSNRQPSGVIPGGPATDDHGCMHAMLRGLESTMQMVEKAVRNAGNPSHVLESTSTDAKDGEIL